MAERPVDLLDRHRRDSGLTLSELWLRYFELGGMSSTFELQAILLGALHASAHELDVIAHALNERFTELGADHPVPYAGDTDDAGDALCQ